MKIVTIPSVRTFHLESDPRAQATAAMREVMELFSAVERGKDFEEVEDEWADSITALVNLADLMGINVAEAMYRCDKRQEERGRYE